jgi:hypothetical protein
MGSQSNASPHSYRDSLTLLLLPSINLLHPALPSRWDGKRKVGKRLPTLKTLLNDPKTSWQPVTIHGWYGGHSYDVQVISQTAVWYHTGLPALPIRWVLVKDPKGKFEPQAFLCTDLCATPKQILEWFRSRWQMEVTFEEVRAHLGVETQRQWSEARNCAHDTCITCHLFSGRIIS